jgi:hypothetical protein
VKIGAKTRLVIFVVMTALSALLAAQGQAAGFIGLIFFGGGGAVLFYMDRRTRAKEKPTASSPGRGTLPGAARHTSQPEGSVYLVDRKATVAALAAAVVFVVVGVLFLAAGGVVLMAVGALSVLVFGLFGLLLLRTVLSSGNGVALLPEGVYFRSAAGTAWLPWDAVGRAWVMMTSNQPSIALIAEPPEALVVTGLNAWLRGMNQRRFGMDVAYSGRSLARPPEEVCAAIRRCAGDPAARRERLARRNGLDGLGDHGGADGTEAEPRVDPGHGVVGRGQEDDVVVVGERVGRQRGGQGGAQAPASR